MRLKRLYVCYGTENGLDKVYTENDNYFFIHFLLNKKTHAMNAAIFILIYNLFILQNASWLTCYSHNVSSSAQCLQRLGSSQMATLMIGHQLSTVQTI